MWSRPTHTLKINFVFDQFCKPEIVVIYIEIFCNNAPFIVVIRFFFSYRNNLGLIILSYISFLAFGGIYLLETSPKHMTVLCVLRWYVEYLVILARGWVCVLILKTLGSTDLATVFVFRYLWFSTHAQWLYARLRYYFFRSNRFMHWIFHLPDFKFYVPWSMMCNFIAVSINLRINRFRQIHCN